MKTSNESAEPQPAALTTEQLIARAAKAKRSNGRCNTERWIPVIDMLRRKNWGYAEIYRWLKDEGEPVQKNAQLFTAAVSRRYRRWLERQRIKALENAEFAKAKERTRVRR